MISDGRHAIKGGWFFLLLSVLALAGFALVSAWADFPYFYHTDEPGKVRQILGQPWNFHHPLLMLEWVRLAWLSSGSPSGFQQVVEIGRTVTAAACALSACLLAVTLAGRWGYGAALLAAPLFFLQRDVQEYGRYFKEDPFLTMGWAAVFAAMAGYEKRPGLPMAAVCGAALGLAVSAKYIGVVMGIPVVWVLILVPAPAGRGQRFRHASAVLLAAAVVTLLINLRMVFDPDTFRASLGKETRLVLEGQADVTQSLPNWGFFARLGSRSWHLLPFWLLGMAAAWQTRREGWTAFLLIISPLALAGLLACSAKDSGRYFMPASLGLAGGAAVGLAFLAAKVAGPWRTRAVVAGALLLLAGSAARSWTYIEGFRNDGRRDLLDWMRENLPPGSRVLQGWKVCLPGSGGEFSDGWKQGLPEGVTLETTRLSADLGENPAALAALGFTHLALAGDESYRYLRSDQSAKKGYEEGYARRRAFYQSLLRDGKLLWSRDSGKIGTHNPELRLYRLPPAQ